MKVRTDRGEGGQACTQLMVPAVIVLMVGKLRPEAEAAAGSPTASQSQHLKPAWAGRTAVPVCKADLKINRSFLGFWAGRGWRSQFLGFSYSLLKAFTGHTGQMGMDSHQVGAATDS